MYKTISYVTIESLKKNCTLIHYFGLGFIQIKLGSQFRIHFYTNELPAIIGDEEIHNHRYDFTSTILHGTFSQKLYQVIPGDTHTIEDESCTEGVHSDQQPDACGIRLLSEETYTAGSHYTISHATFHTVSADCAITFLDRKPYAKQFAQVIRPKNNPKTCPFSKKIPEAELWNIVEKMLEKAHI